jgi:phosphate transport system permease protein
VNNTTKPAVKTADLVQKGLSRRYRTEAVFKGFGLFSIAVGLLALSVLMFKIIGGGASGFRQTYIQMPVHFDADVLGISDVKDPQQMAAADFEAIVKAAIAQQFPDVTERRAKRELHKLLSIGASYDLKDQLLAHPEWLGQTKTLWLLADDDVDTYFKSYKKGKAFTARTSEARQAQIQTLIDRQAIDTHFNTRLFTAGDSSEPELAGIRGAITGTLLTLLVTLALSFPIGVAAAIYLEEYAPQNRLTDLIEVNVSNLAAVPSVIFGLLGLAVFINLFGLPRSVPLVGGLVLTLLTLPTIIISSRNAIKAVPPSIREAALGLGASKMQVILHHVLPLAMPGMLTGAILGMAHALGETAPLLMIGMVAFVMDVPQALTDPATVLPVQIYLWSDSPERAFVERTSAAIMVLLMFLVCMNVLAVWLRRRLERRW